MAKKIRLDFSKVEERSGWNTKEIPEGLHEMKIVGAEVGEAKDGTDMITYALVPTSAKYKTRRFPYYCKLQPNQLFKIRDLFVAVGLTIPKKVTTIDPEAPVGKLVAAEISDETGQYAGRSTVDGVYGTDILDDADDAGDEPDEDDVDDEEEYEDEVEEDDIEEDEEADALADELEALSLPELRKRAKGLGIDHAGVKKADLIALVLEEELGEDEEDEEDDLGDEDLEDDEDDEEYEDDEDEEEEEEPAPKRRAAPARKPAAKATPARRTVKRR